MKIKEVMHEGVLSGLTDVVNRAPSRLSAGTTLAADPSEFKKTTKKAKAPKKIEPDGVKLDTEAEKAKMDRLTQILAGRARQKGSITLTDIGKAIPKSGQYHRNPDEMRDLVQSIASELKSQGINVIGKYAPGAGGDIQAVSSGEEVTWDPSKQTLTISDADGSVSYQRTRKGWKDVYTGDIIAPQDAREIQAAFDKETGRVAPKVPSKLPSTAPAGTKLTVPSGEVVTKSNDGYWYDAEGAYIANVNDVKRLEQMARNELIRQQAKR